MQDLNMDFSWNDTIPKEEMNSFKHKTGSQPL